MARTQAQDKYDEQHYVFQSVKIRRQLRDDFKAACAARGERVNSVLREAMERYVEESAADGSEQRKTAYNGQKRPCQRVLCKG